MRSMVEGGRHLHHRCDKGTAPSTSFAGPPPRTGEDQKRTSNVAVAVRGGP